MNVMEAIHSRHSYRGKYKDVPVPKEDLMKIMQAGLDAPSGCNKQTTSLIAVDDPEILARLHRVIDPPVGETAPAAVCVLAIVELGYQSCWYEGHITDDDRICDKMAQILNIPDSYELVCYLPVGIAEGDSMQPVKKAFEERAWFNSFPQA
jgi:nitroreductase